MIHHVKRQVAQLKRGTAAKSGSTLQNLCNIIGPIQKTLILDSDSLPDKSARGASHRLTQRIVDRLNDHYLINIEANIINE